MGKDKVAKNILVGRTCYTCRYYVWKLDDIRFCANDVHSNQNQSCSPYISTKPISKELTCDNWRSYGEDV